MRSSSLGRRDAAWCAPTDATELLRLGPFRVLLVEAEMPVVHRRELPLDKEVLYVGAQFKRLAVRHAEVGEFSLLDGPALTAQAEKPRRLQRDTHYRFY